MSRAAELAELFANVPPPRDLKVNWPEVHSRVRQLEFCYIAEYQSGVYLMAVSHIIPPMWTDDPDEALRVTLLGRADAQKLFAAHVQGAILGFRKVLAG